MMTMRAVIFDRPGSSEVLKVANVPLPEPGRGEVRLRLTSVGLNRADSLFSAGRYFCKPDFETSGAFSRIGFEGAGVVDAVGEGVKARMGGRVAVTPLTFDVSENGCLAEYGVYPETALIPTPDSVPDKIAGGIWMQYLTAWGGLVIDGGLQKNQTVVITAASSSVGIAAIQIANMIGAISVATTTNQAKMAQLKKFGAENIINMRTEDYVERIKKITRNKGADLIFDAVAGPGTKALIQGTAQGGKLIIQGMLDRRPMAIHAGALMKKMLTVKGFRVDGVVGDPRQLNAGVKVITEGLDRGQWAPVIAENFPLEAVHDAFSLLESNQHIGKIVINP